MKVVLFCGGLGMRLREHSDAIPKPMVHVGCRPILWHLMKYYAHYGHNEFVLCLGWKGDYIKNYFLNYNECISSDFTIRGDSVTVHNQDLSDWTITFVDTGQKSVVGERLVKVRKYLQDEPRFLANYSDGLSDLPLPHIIDHHERSGAVATCLGVKPTQSFHILKTNSEGQALAITPVSQIEQWMNGGFFVLEQEIFDYMRPGEDLACEPFQRLIAAGKLTCHTYSGYWGCMDTYKEKQDLDAMYAEGNTPWEIWNVDTPQAPSPSKVRSVLPR